MKAKSLRQKSVTELQRRSSASARSSSISACSAARAAVRPHLMREVRKNVARAKTVLREKQGKS